MTKAPIKPKPKRPVRQSATPSEPTGSQTAEDARTSPLEAGDDDLVGTFMSRLDEALLVAQEAVDDLSAKLAKATRHLRVIDTLIKLRDGGEDASPIRGGRSPRKASTQASTGIGAGLRGAVPVSVHKLLSEAGADGLTRSEILAKLQIGSDNKSGQQSVSNFLASAKRASKIIHHPDGRYTLAD